MLLLEIIRDGRRTSAPLLFQPITDDTQGNLVTLAAMARIVREDVVQPDLRAFVNREVVGSVPGHAFRNEIDACFEFARDRIVYRRDPVGVERVADLWSTMYALNPERPEGDCGIKSVFLATCLGLLGHTPFFVLMSETAAADSYSHVYVGTILNGEYIPLDPTPEDFLSGQRPAAMKEMIFPIFGNTGADLKALRN